MAEFAREGGEELLGVRGAGEAADELGDLRRDGDACLRHRVHDEHDAIGQREEMDEIRTLETHEPLPGSLREPTSPASGEVE